MTKITFIKLRLNEDGNSGIECTEGCDETDAKYLISRGGFTCNEHKKEIEQKEAA